MYKIFQIKKVNSLRIILLVSSKKYSLYHSQSITKDGVTLNLIFIGENIFGLVDIFVSPLVNKKKINEYHEHHFKKDPNDNFDIE